MQKNYYLVVITVLILVLAGLIIFRFLNIAQPIFIKIPPENKSNLPSSLHWHAQVFILIEGNQTEIPANIGIYNESEDAIHTHDNTGILHMEQLRSEERYLKIGYFFNEVWNKTFNSSCVFDYCRNSTHELGMFVNGKRNYNFNNLTMHDNDVIIIVYGRPYSYYAQF